MTPLSCLLDTLYFLLCAVFKDGCIPVASNSTRSFVVIEIEVVFPMYAAVLTLSTDMLFLLV